MRINTLIFTATASLINGFTTPTTRHFKIKNNSAFLVKARHQHQQPQHNNNNVISTSKQQLQSSSSDDNNEPLSSQLEGNYREPTPQELSVMDDMITKLSQAKPYELPNAVKQAFRVVSSPKFFLRIAQRTDVASSVEEKERLMALATNLVSTLDAVVSTAEDKLEELTSEVQRILQAAAEPVTGEFLVPLSSERVQGMKEVMEQMESSQLSEGFLATVDSWMNKSKEDGIDGMVVILQKVLQLYAGIEISRARQKLLVQVSAAVTGEKVEEVEDILLNQINHASKLLETLLQMDTDLWEEEIVKNIAVNDEEEDSTASTTTCSFSQITKEVQRTMEGVVLGLENGSMAQRVQAEYLRELVVRIEALEKKK